MDPYHCIDISYTDESTDLNEFCSCYPNGDWDIVAEDNNSIVYKNNYYDSIHYEYDTKTFSFVVNNKIEFQMELILEEKEI